MQVKTWVMATILFSGAFALLVLMMTDATNTYGAQNIIDEDIEERYNKLSESAALVDSLSDSVKEEGGLSLIGGVRTLFQSTIGIVNAVFNSLALIPAVTAGFASDFGIPTAVTYLFFLIGTILITVGIIFAILNAGSGGRV